MKAYLARLNAKQQHPYEIVGVFVARDRDQLLDLVDECTDVYAVDITELGAGSIFWAGRADMRLPMNLERNPDFNGLPGGATVSELWSDKFFAAHTRWEALIEPEELQQDN